MKNLVDNRRNFLYTLVLMSLLTVGNTWFIYDSFHQFIQRQDRVEHSEKITTVSVQKVKEAERKFYFALVFTSLSFLLLIIFLLRQTYLYHARLIIEASSKRLENRAQGLLNQISKISAEERDFNFLAREMLRIIVVELDAIAGKLYLKDENNLIFISSCGVSDVDKDILYYLDDTTLIAEAFHKGDVWQINNFSDTQLVLETSLIKGRPNSLIFIPIFYQDTKIGMLEMGSFHSLTAEERFISNELKKSFGPILNSVTSRLKMKKLLAETQESKKALEKNFLEMNDLRNLAETANVAKRYFLANMSHEIRTPLSSILGFSEILLKKDLRPDEKTSCQTAIRRNGKLLMRLLGDILDFSKIEANQLDLDKSVFSLNELIENVSATFGYKAKEKSIQFLIDSSVPFDSNYHADANRLEQIIYNVVGNAIKFTLKGKVEVFFQLEAGTITDTLRVRVKDQGIGINSEQVKNLFKPFSQMDSTTSRKFGGTGLGLTISKGLANLMGGDLYFVESIPDHGSTFEMIVPLEKIGQHFRIDRGSEHRGDKTIEFMLTDFGHLNVLAIDDSQDNLMLIEMFLEPTNAKLTCVENGFEALKQVAKNCFDVILMDIQLPEMDGHDITRKMREQGITTPIVALTAHAIKSEHERCYASGCTDILTKPLFPKNLIETILRVTKK